MIVYTVRGGVSAVIWTDVVQMFIYVAGALRGVLRRCCSRSPAAGARSSPRRARGQVHGLRLHADPTRVYTFWAGVLGGVALTLATHGTDQFLVQRLLSARSARDAAGGPDPQRLHRLRAVRAVPGHRRDALHVLPAHAAAAAARHATTRCCRSSSSRRCRTASPASSSRRSSPRRCRRRSTRWRRRRSTTSI